MTPVVWLTAGALGTAAAASFAIPQHAPAIVLGMLAPLVAVAATWMAVIRAVRRDPACVTALLIRGFGVKALFFAAYVVGALGVLEIAAVPFVVSFTAYFIALYFAEALLLSRLFIGRTGQAR